jgi:hypothetical protein
MLTRTSTVIALAAFLASPAFAGEAPPTPQAVMPTVLSNLRTSGETQILPDAATVEEIQRSGKSKVIGSFKLCVSITGDVTGVVVLKSTGFPAYDKKITAGIRTWKHRPYLVDKKPMAVCSAETFIYKPPPPPPPSPPAPKKKAG